MKIVAVITGQNLSKELQNIKKYKTYLYAVEIRADFMYPQLTKINTILTKLKSFLPSIKTILTFRWVNEGGKTKIPEHQRKELILRLLNEHHKHIEFVDIEYLSPIYEEVAKAVKQNYHKKLITSCHFNTKSPYQKIKRTIKQVLNKHQSFDVFKLVFYTQNLKQYLNILVYVYSLNKDFQKTTIFTVGPTSFTSRLISAILSMPLIYTAAYTPAISSQPTLPQFIKSAHKLGILSD